MHQKLTFYSRWDPDYSSRTSSDSCKKQTKSCVKSKTDSHHWFQLFSSSFFSWISREIICDTAHIWALILSACCQTHRNAQHLDFSCCTHEVKVQNLCTLLLRHSTDTTYHVSSQSPAKLQRSKMSPYQLFCLIENTSLLHRTEALCVCVCVTFLKVHECAYIHVCVCIQDQSRRGVALKVKN